MSRGEPVWALATLFPKQGDWSEEDYLSLELEHPRVELVDGVLEVLPEPTERHQRVLSRLALCLTARARGARARLSVAGPCLRLRAQRFAAPDLMLLGADSDAARAERCWTRADLVVEVVGETPEEHVRDRHTKRREYEAAGIQEYWIVDPFDGTLLQLRHEGGVFEELGVWSYGESLSCGLLGPEPLALAELLG